jgi:hypothetical protein
MVLALKHLDFICYLDFGIWNLAAEVSKNIERGEHFRGTP